MLLQNLPNGDVGNLTQGKTNASTMTMNMHATDPQRAQERWVIAPDNILMGSSWEIPNGKVGYAYGTPSHTEWRMTRAADY
jgi:hypothetical protein